ncbi:MAG: hypothetical protein Q9P90_19050 [candidate division KSB1 bacterium]|nr:hypothetical protein [candidate division KSB1 bacterium]
MSLLLYNDSDTILKQAKKRKTSTFSTFLHMLYIAGFAAVAYLIREAWPYYTLGLSDRPRSPLHTLWKPGGFLGHGLGIIGSAMILLLFLYSARKRQWFGLRWGKLSRWLDIHIFFGIFGPILVTLHTSFKLNGFISIGYFALLAVMFSGIIGRYIYMQIPHTLEGHALTLEQLDSKDRLITRILVEKYRISKSFLMLLQKLSGAHLAQKRRGFWLFISLLFNDLLRGYRFRKIRRYLVRHNPDIPGRALKELLHLSRQKTLLMRRKLMLHFMQKAFHYWHVLHKPFAYLMLVLMFLHVAIVLALGYKWIF